jgi:hypothetical protein
MQLKNVIAHDLNEMDIWPQKWLMSFNPDKTEIMMSRDIMYDSVQTGKVEI